jgi:uncharacterized protein (TIGR01244 family)
MPSPILLAPDPAHIANWLRIDAGLTTSGRLTPPDVPALAGIGVRTVINLALDTHEHALAGEAERMAAAGMAYVHIPVAFDAPTEADFARFCVAMRDAGAGPVHVHCIMNMRVSAFVYRWRRDVLGVDGAIARADLERIWQPGGAWAALIGDAEGAQRNHMGPRG